MKKERKERKKKVTELEQEMEHLQDEVREEVKAKKEGIKLLKGIRVKLVGVFMIPVLLIILLGYFSYEKSSKGIITNYEISTLTSMDMLAKYFSLGFNTVEAKTKQLCTNEDIINYYSGRWESDIITQITKRKDIETGIITNVITEDYMQNIYIISN